MTDVCPEDISLSELEKRWGVTRNTLRSRAKALGVETLHPTHNSSLWPGKYLELGDQLHEHLRNGGELALFPGVQLARAEGTEITAPSEATEPTADPRDELRRLKACIADGDWFTMRELSVLLNRSASAISRWPDDFEIRPEIWVKRRKLNGIWFYKVLTASTEAPLSLQPVRTDSSERSLPGAVGFKAMLPTFNCHY